MKKSIVLIIAALFIVFNSFAQAEDENPVNSYPTPKWVSEKGYWVIESNLKTPDQSIVYFYTNDDVLVYKEKINGLVLNLNKRKIKMSLKQVLEQSVYAYEKLHKPSENEMWVVNTIKR